MTPAGSRYMAQPPPARHPSPAGKRATGPGGQCCNCHRRQAPPAGAAARRRHPCLAAVLASAPLSGSDVALVVLPASLLLTLYSAPTPSARAMPRIACTTLPCAMPTARRVRAVSRGYTTTEAVTPAGQAGGRASRQAGRQSVVGEVRAPFGMEGTCTAIQHKQAGRLQCMGAPRGQPAPEVAAG